MAAPTTLTLATAAGVPPEPELSPADATELAEGGEAAGSETAGDTATEAKLGHPEADREGEPEPAPPDTDQEPEPDVQLGGKQRAEAAASAREAAVAVRASDAVDTVELAVAEALFGRHRDTPAVKSAEAGVYEATEGALADARQLVDVAVAENVLVTRDLARRLEEVNRDPNLTPRGKGKQRDVRFEKARAARRERVDAKLDAAAKTLREGRAEIEARWAAKTDTSKPTDAERALNAVRLDSMLRMAGSGDDAAARVVTGLLLSGEAELAADGLLLAAVAFSDPLKLRSLARQVGSHKETVLATKLLADRDRTLALAEYTACGEALDAIRQIRQMLDKHPAEGERIEAFARKRLGGE